MSYQRITLDNPAFAGRLRSHRERTYKRRPIIVLPRSNQISDITVTKPPALQSVQQSQPKNETLTTTNPLQFHQQDTKVLKRELVTKPEPTSKSKKVKKTNILFTAMAVFAFVFGTGVAIMQLRTNRYVAAQVKQVTKASATNSDSAPPSETKPTNLGAYVVPPNQPRYLKIPKLNVDARVRQLGVTAQGQLQAPNNIYDTGWYNGSSKPGDAGGAVLIDGHVHGPTLPGVFYNLKSLLPGDIIQIERGDGKVFSFKVVKLQSYDANNVDMAAALTSIVPGKLGLNLMTCTGKVKGTEYEQRLIVFAVAV